MKKEAPLIVEFTNEDVLVAKQALAALTRLRNMSFNPFTEPEKGHQLKEDEITLKKAFELLGIPGVNMIQVCSTICKEFQESNNTGAKS